MAKKWQASFIEALAGTGNVRRASEIAGVSHVTAYAYRKTDSEFAAAWDEALSSAVHTVMEPEAIRRAIEGVEEPVGWHKGQAGGYVRKYSDTLLIFLLKAHAPDKYRERSEVTHKGDDESPIRILNVVRPKGGNAGDS